MPDPTSKPVDPQPPLSTSDRARGAPTGGLPTESARGDANSASPDAVSATDRPAAHVSSAEDTTEAPHTTVQSFEFPDLVTAGGATIAANRVSMLSDVNLNIRIELGRTRMLVEDVLQLGEGSVVELDKLAGDPVDVYVNDRLVARGEVLVLNDNFCVRISDVLSRDPHRVIQ